MNRTVGKPLLGLMAAACVAVPVGIPHAAAAAPEPVVRPAAATTAHSELFDPAPPVLRLVPDVVDRANAASAVAAMEAIDPALLVKLLSFPYHNIYGIGTAFGAAVNSVVVAGLLPLTAGYYLLTNQVDKIGPYIDTTFANLGKAVPNIFTAIQTEIDYDKNLFQQVFNPSGSGADAVALAAANADPTGVDAAAAIDPALLVKLLSFPYHNIYGIGTAFGAAVNSVVVAGLLPLTAGYYLLTNQVDKIGPYIDTTIANLGKAVPNIFTAIQTEIDYDKNLFQQIFNPAPAAEMNKVLESAGSATLSAAPEEEIGDASTPSTTPSVADDGDDVAEVPSVDDAAETDVSPTPATPSHADEIQAVDDTEQPADETVDTEASDAPQESEDPAATPEPAGQNPKTGGDEPAAATVKSVDNPDTYGRHAKKDVPQDAAEDQRAAS